MRSTSKMRYVAALWVAATFVSACNSSDDDNVSAPPSGGGNIPTTSATAATITIQNLTFSPADLVVSPGATVTVMNNDGIPHSVTSEAAKDQFVFGAVNGVSFDTGIFSSGSMTFNIPANAPAGTVVPYFCNVHKAAMPQGTVTIQAAAAAPTTTATQPPAPVPTTAPTTTATQPPTPVPTTTPPPPTGGY